MEINEDHPNDNKQSYLFRNSYTQGGGPPSLVTDKDSNTGRGVESFSVKKKRGKASGVLWLAVAGKLEAGYLMRLF